MRQYMGIEREEMAANGQRRIWARVASDELIMTKVDVDATEEEIATIVNNLILAEENSRCPPQLTPEQIQIQIAALQAQLQSLGGSN